MNSKGILVFALLAILFSSSFFAVVFADYKDGFETYPTGATSGQLISFGNNQGWTFLQSSSSCTGSIYGGVAPASNLQSKFTPYSGLNYYEMDTPSSCITNDYGSIGIKLIATGISVHISAYVQNTTSVSTCMNEGSTPAELNCLSASTWKQDNITFSATTGAVYTFFISCYVHATLSAIQECGFDNIVITGASIYNHPSDFSMLDYSSNQLFNIVGYGINPNVIVSYSSGANYVTSPNVTAPDLCLPIITTSPNECGQNKNWVISPASYWPLDEGSGTTANDLSGNSYTGTLVNSPTWLSGSNCVLGDCLNFTASANTGVTTNLLFANSSGAISAWVKVKTINDYGIVAGWKSGTSYVLIDEGVGSWRAVWDPNGSGETDITGSTITTGIFVLLTFTWSLTGSTYYLSFYENGALQGTASVAEGTNTAMGGFQIGEAGSTDSCNAAIDNVAVFNTALSSAQVSSLQSNLGVPLTYNAIQITTWVDSQYYRSIIPTTNNVTMYLDAPNLVSSYLFQFINPANDLVAGDKIFISAGSTLITSGYLDSGLTFATWLRAATYGVKLESISGATLFSSSVTVSPGASIQTAVQILVSNQTFTYKPTQLSNISAALALSGTNTLSVSFKDISNSTIVVNMTLYVQNQTGSFSLGTNCVDVLPQRPASCAAASVIGTATTTFSPILFNETGQYSVVFTFRQQFGGVNQSISAAGPYFILNGQIGTPASAGNNDILDFSSILTGSFNSTNDILLDIISIVILLSIAEVFEKQYAPLGVLVITILTGVFLGMNWISLTALGVPSAVLALLAIVSVLELIQNREKAADNIYE